MAAYISFQPTDYFSPKLYTGDASAGQTYTGLGFAPDLVWSKSRTAGNNSGIYDSVRGVEKLLYSNESNAETTTTDGLSAFGADGITFGASGTIGDSSNFVNWCWKAGTTSVPSGGSITPSAVSLNTTAGFGIYKYGGASATSTIAHGLGAAPTLIIVKGTSHATNWQVGSTAMDSTWNYVLYLNLTHIEQNEIMYGDTAPDSTYFTLGNASETNNTGRDYIAYAWTPIKGYSSFGKYEGNGNNDGPFVYTGFRPAFIMTKSYSASANSWYMMDRFRTNPYNPQDGRLEADGAGTEQSTPDVDFCSNGFKLRALDGGFNTDGTNYIYMAFAEFPIVSSNSKAGTAR